jgi:hypothetical protein
MPIVVAVPLSKNSSQKRQNGNLLQAWVVVNPFAASTNTKKLFVTSNNTIATIFNELDFTQGSTGGSADQLSIFNPLLGTFTAYFFRLDVQKWRLVLNRSGPDQNDVVIPNKTILRFTKIISGSSTITLKGSARVGVYT